MLSWMQRRKYYRDVPTLKDRAVFLASSLTLLHDHPSGTLFCVPAAGYGSRAERCAVDAGREGRICGRRGVR